MINILYTKIIKIEFKILYLSQFNILMKINLKNHKIKQFQD